jgi:glutamyl-Q tRNA(Asp) synthetase
MAWTKALENKGEFFLRMEDLDRSRVRGEYYDAIEEDLAWLGLSWTEPVLRQSDRILAYEAALQQLRDLGLTYTCNCSRRDIESAISAPQEGDRPRLGADGLVYPGTCRLKGHSLGDFGAIRLNLAAAINYLGCAEALGSLSFVETGKLTAAEPMSIALCARAMTDQVGDFVLFRRDGAFAYHLAVVVDDAFQGITHVTRGEDLYPATFIHRLLQELLGLPTPIYHHHSLVRDETGKRLAKRDDSRAIAMYRADGLSPAEVLDKARASGHHLP